jgi:hypothetical protein
MKMRSVVLFTDTLHSEGIAHRHSISSNGRFHQSFRCLAMAIGLIITRPLNQVSIGALQQIDHPLQRILCDMVH